MSHIDHRLTTKVSAGFQGGPEWSTAETPLKSGISLFMPRWSMPRFKFVADYTELVNAGLGGEVMTAFIVAMGRANSFRFKDWNDFHVTDQPIGTGDGTSDPIQLVKTYTFGASTYTRDIVLPIGSTVVVKQNGTPKAVTVNSDGTVTPATAWSNGAALTWSGQFDVKVRFGQDYYPFTRVGMKISQCTVDLVEDKG